MAESTHTSIDGQPWPPADGAERDGVERRSGGVVYTAVCAGLGVAIALAAIAIVSQLNRRPPPVYRVISGSMEPTLAVDQVVNVDPSAYASARPRIGDIVAVRAPAGATAQPPACGAAHSLGAACPQSSSARTDQIFIKRIVAGPGDTVAVANGLVVRDGVVQAEPFAAPCDAAAACNLPDAITVPAGEWFLMGDNRERSDDSRSWGPVPTSWIIGKVTG